MTDEIEAAMAELYEEVRFRVACWLAQDYHHRHHLVLADGKWPASLLRIAHQNPGTVALSL